MSKKTFKLGVISIRPVRKVPIISEEKISSPKAAISLLGNLMCEMDREVVCVVTLKSDMTPINCNIAGIGAINQAIAELRGFLKTVGNGYVSACNESPASLMIHLASAGGCFLYNEAGL